jgi:hypothetical protein
MALMGDVLDADRRDRWMALSLALFLARWMALFLARYNARVKRNPNHI